MRITLLALSGAFAATAAQAGSIQVIDAPPTTFPSIQAVGNATVALPAQPVNAPAANPATIEDGRSQLEAWAKANNTTVEKLLLERTNGFLTLKNKNGNGGDGANDVASKDAKPSADEKTASVDDESEDRKAKKTSAKME
jgi:hypothetical protein